MPAVPGFAIRRPQEHSTPLVGPLTRTLGSQDFPGSASGHLSQTTIASQRDPLSAVDCFHVFRVLGLSPH
jgi:hypothetical protein